MLKRTKKGILVNMDDQLVEQLDDEADFIIAINFDNQLGHFEVILECGWAWGWILTLLFTLIGSIYNAWFWNVAER